MPRSKQKKQYKDIKEYAIFLLKHPRTKEFFIGKTLAHNMRSTYKDHYIETKYKTVSMVRELKQQGLKPCCFELETVSCTAVQAYRHMVVWTKIFMEQGYKNLDTGSITNYAADLLPENIPLYEARKNIDISKLTSCKNCLFPNYGRTNCLLKKE